MTTKPTHVPPEPPEIAPSPLAVLTGNNQLTLQEGVLAEFPDAIFFEVVTEKGRIVLTPVEPSPIEAVWAKIAALGITEEDVAER